MFSEVDHVGSRHSGEFCELLFLRTQAMECQHQLTKEPFNVSMEAGHHKQLEVAQSTT